MRARRDAALAAVDQNRVISSTGGQGADFGNGPDFGPGVTTTTSRRDSAVQRMHVTMDFNEQGFNGFIDRRTGQTLQDALR
jgi:hypothetical protein